MMILSLLLAAQVSQLPPAQPIPPPDFETANVLAPIQQLFDAFERGDSAAMLRIVYPDGRVTATGQRASSSGLRSQSWAEFARRVTPTSRFTETISDQAVEIDGDVAMVWAPFVVRIDGKVASCGYDLFRPRAGEWRLENHELELFLAHHGLPGTMNRTQWGREEIAEMFDLPRACVGEGDQPAKPHGRGG